MDRKLKNTLILSIILVLIIIGGSLFAFWYQKGKVEDLQKSVDELNFNARDTQELVAELNYLKLQAAELDSILALRKFNIPTTLKQSAFFEFINQISYNFEPQSYVNVEYIGQDIQSEFEYFLYKVSGVATFNDFYKLIYGIEHSKALKKVLSVKMEDFVQVTDEGYAYYLVNYELGSAVFFAANNRFSAVDYKENNLTPNPLYDVFFPLIRNEIPPNRDNLLDVQTAHLLGLIPDGAFLADDKGDTYLLWEGDKVYLGYLTEIDYETSEVYFVLNKGGIIEKITLKLERGIDKK